MIFENSQKSNKGGNVSGGDPAPTGGREPETDAPLSTAHITPKVIYNIGSSILKTTKGVTMTQVGGGKKGNITGFSKKSRRALMQTIAKVDRLAKLPLFVTLTYPDKFPTVQEAKRDLDKFIKRINRHFPDAGLIWKLEPQERGAPHYHMMVWGVEVEPLFYWVCENWWDIAGQDDKNALLFLLGALDGSKKCVEQVRSWRGVWSYAAKYLGKTFEVAKWGDQWTGRYWGVIKKANIPFGQEVTIDMPISDIVDLMRYQRRFSGIKGKDRNSMTIFCDADQWIKNLIPADRINQIALADCQEETPSHGNNLDNSSLDNPTLPVRIFGKDANASYKQDISISAD